MQPQEMSLYLLIAIIAMAICMAVIPIVMKLAPVIGMLDKPDSRKVHRVAIPRTGGIGLVIGMLIPLLIWIQPSKFEYAFLFGCFVLLVFGTWDDARNIRPTIKFFGQILAAVSVVYYGDLYIFHFPFMGLTELPEYIGKPFTVFAIVGAINALNLSDGLDGLAGGEALISLVAISWLAYQYDSIIVMLIAAAAIGGIFGFLRFNSHPARVFMGDSGSQTLGFVVGVLVVYLTQKANSVFSPMIVLLLLGLPVIDSLVVFYLRARRGDSLVVAAKDHLHHRLMAIGFYHYQSVIIIYSIQVLFVVAAVLLPYANDALIMGVYLITCAAVFFMLTLAERKGWKIHHTRTRPVESLSQLINQHERVKLIPGQVLEAAISLFVVAAALLSDFIPTDFAYSSAILFFLLLLTLFSSWLGDALYRLIMFVTIAFSVYLLSNYPTAMLLKEIDLVYLFFAIITMTTFVAVRLNVDKNFRITPMDYLVIITGLIIGLAPGINHSSSSMVWMILQIIILFYACELVIQQLRKQRMNRFSASFALALGLIALRGLF